MAAQKSFDAVMASDKNGPRRDTTWVCFSDAISEQYNELEEQLTTAVEAEERRRQPRDPDQTDTRRRLSGDTDMPASEAVAKSMADLVEANPDAFYEVQLSSLPRSKWRALRSQHPPRDNEPEDGGLYTSE